MNVSERSSSCYDNVSGWLVGWLLSHSGIESKRLNLSKTFFDPLVATAFKHLGPLRPVPNSKGTVNTRGGKIGDFRPILPFISETMRYRSMLTIERQ